MDDIPEEYQFDDETLNKVWANANFGDRDKRSVITETLLQIGGGFSTGHTALCICQELGLVGKNKRKPVLTKKGRRVMYYWNKERVKVLKDALKGHIELYVCDGDYLESDGERIQANAIQVLTPTEGAIEWQIDWNCGKQ